MTKFAQDLIRYLESTRGSDYDSLTEQFFFQEIPYSGGTPWKYNHWKTGDLVDDTPEGWGNMNVSFACVDSYGGEGQGDTYYSVYKFTDNSSGEEVYLKFNGWYASYNGAEYTDLSIVRPKEKTVVAYE